MVESGRGTERLTRRTLLGRGALVGGVLVGGTLLEACGSSGDTKTAAKATAAKPAGGVSAANFYDGKPPQAGGLLRYGMTGGSPVDTMDPAKGTPSPQSYYYGTIMYDQLWVLDAKTLVPNPTLVEEVERNDKGTEWTLRLKEGVEFHNGKTLGPADVLASIARMLDPKLASARAGQLKLIDMKASKPVDARTVKIVLKQGQVTFPESMAQFLYILPEDFDPKKPIGSGAFKFKSFAPGQRASFVKNPNYWGEQAHLDEITLINFASPTAIGNALQAGEIEMGNINYELTNVLKSNKDVHLQSYLTYGYSPFRMRCDAGPTKDPRVRQALRFAADREAMVKGAYSGQGKVANDQYAPQDPDFNPNLEQHTYDPEKAKSLLKAAGAEGLTIELNATELLPGMVAAATVYASRAKAAGINVKVVKKDVPAFFGPSYPEYSFATEYRGAYSYLASVSLNDGPTSTQNLPRFKNEEFSKLYFEAIGEFDDAKRKPKIQRMQEIQQAEGGYLIWGYNNQLKAYRNVGGIVPDIGARAPHWRELWLARS